MSRLKSSPFKLLRTPWEKLPEYPVILLLRERTLQKIFQYLSIPDQVCLSLTCKELFGLFGTKIKHKTLEFPRLLRMRNPLLCVNTEFLSRNELLLRLENRRWAYCANWLKLHPRKEFSRHSLRGPSLEYCTWLGYDMWIVLELSLTDTGRLCVLARHTIRMQAPKDHLHVAEPCFACPHQDLSTLLRDDIEAHRANSYLLWSVPYKTLLSLAPEKEVLKVCPRCPTLITKYSISADMAGFWVIRDLGSCKRRTSRSWFDQSRLTGVNFWRNEIYWWRSEGMLLPRRSKEVLKSTNNIHGWWYIDYY
ncbi:unnamed protein product [Penicillium salamii]|nr:unnamed protein product [Penicillium salamii]CAG8423760.1 unnamed protein product [Penicillium salamii]